MLFRSDKGIEAEDHDAGEHQQAAGLLKADGTYVQDDNGDVSEGTYTRDGDWIKRESSSGTSVGIDYLIYSGRITNSYYIKK